MLIGQDITVTSAVFISIVGICIVMIELGLLSIFVRVLSKILSGNSSKEEEKKLVAKAPAAPVASVPQPVQPVVNNQEIDDEIAGVMVATMLESGLNENEIVFKSITRV